MAVPEHIELAKNGPGAVNAWRAAHGGAPLDLHNAVLPKVILPGAHLAGCQLTNVDFSGGDLSGADLAGALLNEANLDAANLDGATLERANLHDAHPRAGRLSVHGIDAHGGAAGVEGQVDAHLVGAGRRSRHSEVDAHRRMVAKVGREPRRRSP